MNWLASLHALASKNESCVVVLITEVEGSAPRHVGTRMVVTINATYDTIGGGALELEAISHARALLSNQITTPAVSSRQLILGQALSQCCGGRVTLQFDYHPANDFIVHVFGAGHVAQELALILPRLPCRAVFHDERIEWLEKVRRRIQRSGDVIFADNKSAVCHSPVVGTSTRVLDKNPFTVIEQCESNAYFVVMTHSHELDLDLVEAVLTRGDSAYCGLIASISKARSFRQRLLRKGFTELELQQLTAPLGNSIDTGNSPMEVAVAAVADLLTQRQQQIAGNCGHRNPVNANLPVAE